MNKRFASTVALALAACMPIAAHAGFNGDTVTASFNGISSAPVNFGSQTVGAGVEFTGQSTDTFGQVWNFSVDVFNTGVKLSWTESTRAAEPNGGNIQSAPDSFSFDLNFASSTLQPFSLSAFSSSGNYSPMTQSLTNNDLTGPQSVHFGFSRLDSTDSYTLTNPVPEPETYAMLLAGLGLMGGVARRRKAMQA